MQSNESNRRKFIALLGSAVAWPLAARAEQSKQKVWRIGILSPGSPSSQTDALSIFMQELNNLGYIEGNNTDFKYQFADGALDRLPGLAAELVSGEVDLIVARSSFAVEAARQATTIIPIVMTGVGNPVGSGFANSISHPGGNITGITNVSIEVSSKYFEYLHAVAPHITRVGVLINPKHPNHPTVLKQIQAAAQATGASVSAIELRSVHDIDAVLTIIDQASLGALIVPADPTFSIIYPRIAQFARDKRLPTMFGQKSGVKSGGLMSYEPNENDMYRRAAVLVDKILKGARPADLPVEYPTRFSLVINLEIAKVLGIAVPPTVLATADEVIE
jgi:putative tryptophan/tyrosine transport system substrate-binding protein